MRAVAALALTVAAVLVDGTSAPGSRSTPEHRVLVFTKTAGFRHDSIPAGVQALRRLGTRNRLQIDHTEDASAFSGERLRRYDVVVFLLTTGDVLDDPQQAAFRSYIQSGGGFVGVHSASDTEHDWPWYGGLVGAYFSSHPPVQTATVSVLEPRDASTRDVPERWVRTDEWYNFASSPRGAVRVLATLDERSYAPGPGAMGSDHPIAWSHRYDGGRAWYTAGGHTQEAYSERLFLGHLLGGILWAAGPPRITSLSGTVRVGRLVVSGRTATCGRCRAELRIAIRSRVVVTPLDVDVDGVVRGRSAVLPHGTWRYTVVLLDDASGLSSMVQRRVRVG